MPKKKAKSEVLPAPKKKGGRPAILDSQLVAAALVDLKGNISATARRFGVHRSSVQELIDSSDSLQKILADSRETMTDNAENALGNAIERGEAWAVCFYLKTQGKSRGYIERQEITGKDGKELPITFIEVPVATGGRSLEGRQEGAEIQPPSGPAASMG